MSSVYYSCNKASWGSPQSPDCRPLTLDEFIKIDFSKIDLEGLFDVLLSKGKNNANKSFPNLTPGEIPDIQKEHMKTTAQEKRDIRRRAEEEAERARLAKLEAERLEKERLARLERERLERLEKERLAEIARKKEEVRLRELAKLEAEKREKARLAYLEYQRQEQQRLAQRRQDLQNNIDQKQAQINYDKQRFSGYSPGGMAWNSIRSREQEVQSLRQELARMR